MAVTRTPGITVDAQAHGQQGLDVDARGRGLGGRERAHQVRREALVASRDRRVDGEDRVLAHTGQRLLERDAFGHQLARLLGEHEGGVALVEVPDRRIDLQTAPSWRKGPLHISGRGPRDTYG